MRILRRWAIISGAVFATLIIAGFVNILLDDYFVYALALCVALIGLLTLVAAVFYWPTPRYTPLYEKVTRALIVVAGSGLLLAAFLGGSALATTDYLIGSGLDGLDEQEQAAGKAALENAQTGCADEPGDRVRRLNFRLVELQMQPGFCTIDGAPAYQARVQAYTLFMVPTDTVFVHCGSAHCSGPPDQLSLPKPRFDSSTQSPALCYAPPDELTHDSAQARVQVCFQSNLTDAEVKALLAEYKVKPVAVFLWTSGLTATYRVYQPLCPDALLQQARNKAIESWETWLHGPISSARIRMFVSQHSEDEVAGSADLTTHARRLLNLHAQFDQAFEEARNGSPLIFGVEVVGDKADLDRLRADPAVKVALDSSTNVGAKEPGERPRRPAEDRPDWRDPTVAALDAREVYRVLQKLSQAQPVGR